MLLRLSIHNYAIIDDLKIQFSDSLNVITGETGAGKSILLGALSLILGERADTSVLQDKENKSIIEGTFRLPDTEDIDFFFKQNELDREKENIIRREINSSGKSRAFINDTPVNLQQLNHLGILLVDLHQQFDTLQLNRPDFQMEVLDALAGNKTLLQEYQGKYRAYCNRQKALTALKIQNERDTRESDYDQFLFDELDAADFKADELEILEKEQQTHIHAEELKSNLSGAVDMLNENDTAVIVLLRQVQSMLERIEAFHPGIPDLQKRIKSSYIELQDIVAELDNLNDKVSYDEERINFIQERLDIGYKLMKKHGVQTTQDLLDVRDTLQRKLGLVQDADEAIKHLERECGVLLKETKALADKLSASRMRQLTDFIKKVNALLTSVGMPNARLKVEIKPGNLTDKGQDEVAFLFDANKSGNYQLLRKVASGGELSRLMLCIKSLVAHSVSLPTLIFDEIDSGISGEAARQVGNIMRDLANAHQVICITHQPQIAGKANVHFQVYKEDSNGKVFTGIRTLSKEERIQIIAQMLSGEKPGKAAMANARELMEE